MAEDKTFRYGFIILGLFLLAVGMFIMTADRPQVYITFCVMGGIMLISGIVWSMCQCYPKISFIPADTDFENFLSPKALGTTENGIPEKKGPQPPYSRLEEENSMQSPPDYDHMQMKILGSGEVQGVLSAPSLPRAELQAGGEGGRDGRDPYSEPFVETAVAIVHRGLDVMETESHRGQPEASQMAGPQVPAAPLASFKDDLDSSDGSGSRDPSPPEGEAPWSRKVDSQPDHYPDFVLIDATGGDEDSPSPSPSPRPKPGWATSPNFWPGSKLGPAALRDAASEGGLPDPVEASETSPEEAEEEEEDLYYGLKDGPGGTLEEEDLFDFEPDS